MIDPAHHYFPEADSPFFAPFATAFLRMMFAHAKFEIRITELQNHVTGDDRFASKNRWGARKRPKLIRKLIRDSRGNIPEADLAASCLEKAIPICDRRNLLAHGAWWDFDPETEKVTVACDFEREGEESHVDFSARDISEIADRFDDLEVELWKIQSAIPDMREARAG